MPSARGLLDCAKWKYEGGALYIPMDEVSEKHFANALRHLEARIRRELDMVCPVHAGGAAAAEDYAPRPTRRSARRFCSRRSRKQCPRLRRRQAEKSRVPRPGRKMRATSARARKRCATTT